FAEREGNYNLYRMNLTSREETPLNSAVSTELYPAVSPGGRQIAFVSDADGDFDIYVMDSDGRNQRKLTANSVADRAPAWSPDGEWIAFSSDVRGDGGHNLYRIRPDGSDLSELYSSGERNTDPR